MFAVTLKELLPQLKLKLSNPNIENFVFKLHYKGTVTLLLACVILVCAKDYFGERIRCIVSGTGVPEKVIQSYCFSMATFTIVRHYNASLLNSGFLPHPGVGPLSDHDRKLEHTYYQWVPFVLFIQSILFYLPHYVWKKKEGGRIKALVDGLQYASLALEDEDINVNGSNVPSRMTLEKRIEIIRKDIVLRLQVSRTWSVWLVAMEVTNLLHVITEIWLINSFLNGNFLILGISLLFNVKIWDEVEDPLEAVFPKVTKCNFHKFGPSGAIQQHDALCVMSLNIINEKIYTVLWFWFLFLFIASLLAVIWRTLSFFLYRNSLKFNDIMFRHATSKKFDPYKLIAVVNGCQFGDWLFLYYLAKNMKSFVFQRLFIRLADELDKNEKYQYKNGRSKLEQQLASYNLRRDRELLPLKSA